jgi:hypothetical protein
MIMVLGTITIGDKTEDVIIIDREISIKAKSRNAKNFAGKDETFLLRQEREINIDGKVFNTLLTTKDMKKMEWFKTGEDFEILGDKV